ncbi:glycosyltransferase family 2 protein [Hylemonella gracilis]|uniref:Glycosyltransferase family 2 protein n=1 Tax=Hylemonella gracilis TaxID=80880 RepID=A0A4V1A210_9BURK|nr:glycosyltransferase [Hylemonella gracilis]QBK04419.1 glycosyltransferase family 2 protein [Hylemonella gracilis]
MQIHVLIPVFNRLHHTQRVIESLRAQTRANDVRIVVINDGSTDGTRDYLAGQADVTTLEGDGSLWWGGAIDLGLRHVLANASPNDYVLFLNNDTWFAPDYVDTLVRVSREGGGAAVGSVIHEENRDDPLVSIGPRISINHIAVWDLLAELPEQERRSPKPVYRVDALSGRGTLYPVCLFKTHGGMRPRLLPHYLADYEIAMRFARDARTPLLVSSQAIVFSPPVYGNEVAQLGWWERHFGQRSSSNVIRRLAFYGMVGSPLQRLTAPLRLAYFGMSRYLHQKLKPRTSIT